MHVWIVDDDAGVCEAIGLMLDEGGHTSEAVPGGRALLNRLNGAPPDCVLLDLLMPPPDGYVCLSLLRSWPRWAPIPVVVLSAIGDEVRDLLPESDWDLLRVGAVLAKPITTERLCAALADAVPGDSS